MPAPDFNITIRDDKRTKIQHLIFEGDLGVRNIERIKAKIDSIDFKRSEIVLQLNSIESFDLSTVQLIYSLRKSLSRAGKKIKIISDLPDATGLILRNAGFRDLSNLETS